MLELKQKVVSKTEQFTLLEDNKKVGIAFVKIPAETDKPISILKVITNNSYVKNIFCKKVIEAIVKKYPSFSISLDLKKACGENISVDRLKRMINYLGFVELENGILLKEKDS